MRRSGAVTSSMRAAVAIPLLAAALQSCTGAAVRSDISANTFLGLESRLANLKASWVEADLRLLSSTCPNLKPEIRSRLVAQGDTPGANEYDARKQTCTSVPVTQSSISRLRRHASEATSGDAFEDVQRQIEDLRAQTDAAIQAFPTSSFAASNFQPAAASDYRAKHEALARDAGKLAADAVAAARDASGAAMAQARSTDHELDKARARLADDGYTRASADLQQLSTMTSAPDIVAMVTVLFSEVDGAIGAAQGTGRVGGNPVNVAREAVPAAEPKQLTTQVPAPPLPTAPVDTGSRPTESDASTSWPTGLTAYTVILSSVTTRTEAHAKARTFREAGILVGTLHSDDFASLRSGYWVVFSGQYRGLDAARNAAKVAQSLVPDAYVKQIVPR